MAKQMLNNFHEQQAEVFSELVDNFKLLESEMKAKSQEYDELNSKLYKKMAEARAAHDLALKNEAETKAALLKAKKALAGAEASEVSRAEVLEHIRGDEEKIRNEWATIDKQRKDLSASQKDLSKREMFVEVDEARLHDLELRVKKLIDHNKLKDLVSVND